MAHFSPSYHRNLDHRNTNRLIATPLVTMGTVQPSHKSSPWSSIIWGSAEPTDCSGFSWRQYCSWREQTAYSFCEQDDPLFVVESGRRRMVVFARLENQGENAYRAAVNISNSANLLFSRLLVKVSILFLFQLWLLEVYDRFMIITMSSQGQSDIQIECSITNTTATWRSCNITNPFMKSLSQVGPFPLVSEMVYQCN